MRWPDEESATMRLGAPATTSGTRRFTKTKCPRWFVPNCVSNPSAVVPGGQAITPAFAMSTSRGFPSASSRSAQARVLASDARSSSMSSTLAFGGAPARIGSAARSPLASSRTAITRFAPCAASARAVSAPSPADPPVIRIRCPDKCLPSSNSSVVVSQPYVITFPSQSFR